MGKKNKWNVEVDGVQHTIEYKKAFRGKLIVDGNVEIIKSTNPFIMLIDKTINFGNKKIQFVVIGAKADLAVDGFFLNSKKQYVPVDKLPVWTWAFVTLCLLPIVFFLGGLAPILCGIIGTTFCITVSLSPSRSTLEKVIIDIVTTLSVWTLVVR